MNSWVNCRVCDEEYRVVTGVGVHARAVYCPFCGSEIEDQVDEDAINNDEEE